MRVRDTDGVVAARCQPCCARYVSRSENAHLLCTPDGGSIELGTPDPAAVFGHAGMALVVRYAPFKVRWIQLPSEGIPVAVTTYSRYHPGGAMVAVAGI
jgi:hypothetical protein